MPRPCVNQGRQARQQISRRPRNPNLEHGRRHHRTSPRFVVVVLNGMLDGDEFTTVHPQICQNRITQGMPVIRNFLA